jgi:hypothetical protein
MREWEGLLAKRQSGSYAHPNFLSRAQFDPDLTRPRPLPKRSNE